MTPPSPIRIFALGLARERPPDSDLFFFNDTATTEIYTLSLHDALPICHADVLHVVDADVHHLHHTHVLHVGHAYGLCLLKTQTIGMAYMQNGGVMKIMNIGVN